MSPSDRLIMAFWKALMLGGCDVLTVGSLVSGLALLDAGAVLTYSRVSKYKQDSEEYGVVVLFETSGGVKGSPVTSVRVGTFKELAAALCRTLI